MAVPLIGSRNVTGVAIAGLALVLGSWLLAGGFKRNPPGEYITVTGMAESDFSSDLIVWNASFDRTGLELKPVYQKMKEDQEVVRAFLKSKGVHDSELIFTTVNIDKQFDYQNENGVSRRVFTGYHVSQSLTVKSKRVDDIDKVSRESMELIEKGIEFNSNNPEFYYTRLSEMKLSLIEKATADARLRAEKIAKSSGSTLGKLKRSSQGVFQITGQYENSEYSWDGAFNTSSRLKRARVTVSAGYTTN